MSDLRDCLQRGEALLTVIDRCREQTADPELGWNIERMLIDCVLRDLETDARRASGNELVGDFR